MSKIKVDINKLNPNVLTEMIGFDFLFSKKSIVNKIIESNKLLSILFFGPPGCGKSLAIKLILKQMQLEYYSFNASKDHKGKLVEILSNVNHDTKIIIVIEEIHRLNKDKQDILLSYLETNSIYLLATTTENPYFVVNPAIISRLYLFEIKKMNHLVLIQELKKFLDNKNIIFDLEVIQNIVYKSNCDFRQIFMYIDIAINFYQNNKEDILESMFNNSASQLDIDGTNFYDVLSAFHKSVRGSDPDAAIYYLSVLLQSNNLLPIFRRLYAIAYEDISLANPNICAHVHAAIEAAKALGLPEARIPLASITLELCLSPKSNTAIVAIDEAINYSNKYNYPPPKHICDNHYQNAIKLGVSGYKYPHNYFNNWVEQQYLPDELQKIQLYKYNKFSKYETKLNDYWFNIKRKPK